MSRKRFTRMTEPTPSSVSVWFPRLASRSPEPEARNPSAPRRSLWLLLTALLLWAPACSPIRFVVTVGPTQGELQRAVVVSEDGAAGEVAIVDVSGLMVNAERGTVLSRSPNPVSLLHEQLKRVEAEDEVKAVVLRINSPGGGVTASEAMYREVERFKRRSGKPVVAMLMDVAASGGYYLALSADEIGACPSTGTGSVGWVIQTVGGGPALARIGVEAEAITSGPNKDAGNPLGSLDDGERAVLAAMVEDFYGGFMARVRARRAAMGEAELETIADGRVVSGARAVELGLIDATGDIYDGFAAAKRRAGLERADLVRYAAPLARVRSPYSRAGSGAAETGDVSRGAGPSAVKLDVLPASFDLPGGFYYLWRPGVD